MNGTPMAKKRYANANLFGSGHGSGLSVAAPMPFELPAPARLMKAQDQTRTSSSSNSTTASSSRSMIVHDWSEDEASAEASDQDTDDINFRIGPSSSKAIRWAWHGHFTDLASNCRAGSSAERCASAGVRSRHNYVVLSEIMNLQRCFPKNNRSVSFGSSLHTGLACDDLCQVCSFNNSGKSSCKMSFLCDFCHMDSGAKRDRRRGSGAWQVAQMGDARIMEIYQERRSQWKDHPQQVARLLQGHQLPAPHTGLSGEGFMDAGRTKSSQDKALQLIRQTKRPIFVFGECTDSAVIML